MENIGGLFKIVFKLLVAEPVSPLPSNFVSDFFNSLKFEQSPLDFEYNALISVIQLFEYFKCPLDPQNRFQATRKCVVLNQKFDLPCSHKPDGHLHYMLV